MIFDHDAKYGLDFPAAIRAMKITCTRTSIRSPWQNGVAERWVGSCRRELLDHVIPLNTRHLKRLLSDYVSYYHEDRTHLGLRKEARLGGPGRLPMVESFLSAVSEVYTTDTTERPEESHFH